MEGRHFSVQTVSFKMKILINFLILFVKLNVCSEDLFIEGLGDIPIYKEMNYVDDSLILFDKVDGRYVSTQTKGQYSQKEVQEFYLQTLPNFGWKIEKLNLFQRGSERLEINFLNERDGIIAIFSIFPK